MLQRWLESKAGPERGQAAHGGAHGAGSKGQSEAVAGVPRESRMRGVSFGFRASGVPSCTVITIIYVVMIGGARDDEGVLPAVLPSVPLVYAVHAFSSPAPTAVTIQTCTRVPRAR